MRCGSLWLTNALTGYRRTYPKTKTDSAVADLGKQSDELSHSRCVSFHRFLVVTIFNKILTSIKIAYK